MFTKKQRQSIYCHRNATEFELILKKISTIKHLITLFASSCLNCLSNKTNVSSNFKIFTSGFIMSRETYDIIVSLKTKQKVNWNYQNVTEGKSTLVFLKYAIFSPYTLFSNAN